MAAPMGGSEWEEAMSPDWHVLRPPKRSWLANTLQRFDNDPPWHWQSQLFFDRLFRAHPGEILNVLGVPKAWPVGVPLRLSLNPGYAYKYCANDATLRVRLRAGADGWRELGENRISTMPDPCCFEAPAAGRDTTNLDVELLAPRGRVWRGVIAPRLTVEGGIENYLHGVDVPDIREQIVGRHPRISFGDDGQASFMLDNDLSIRDDLSCTLAVNAELIRDGTPVGRATIFRFNISAFTVFTGAWTPIPASAITWDEQDRRYSPDSSRWTVRLTPNESLAMLDYKAAPQSNYYNPSVNTYWKGQVEVPVKTERFDPKADPYEFR